VYLDSLLQWLSSAKFSIQNAYPIAGLQLLSSALKKVLKYLCLLLGEKKSPKTITDSRHFHTAIQLSPSFIMVIYQPPCHQLQATS